MTMDERDKIIEQFMADHDTVMTVAAASTHSDEVTVMECEVSDKDFVWSSR
jgi:hypothetical protein